MKQYTMDEMGGIGVSNLPKSHHASLSVRGCNFNVMIVGSHGLGKTTFLSQFFGIPALRKKPFASKSANKYWYNEDVCNIQISTAKTVESDFTVSLTLVEVDCIGDSTNNAECHEPLADLLETNFRDFEDKLRENVRALVDDRRVHLCLYMLEPLDTVKMVDLEVMKVVSRYCNIVPVIAKADLVDTDQMENIRRNVRDQLDANNIVPYEDRKNGYSAPFFVILGPVDGENLSEERNYLWGSLNLREFAQNEFYALREFILEKSVVHLKNETEFFYDNYRTSRLASYLMEAGKGEENKTIFMRLEEYRREIKEIKGRIKRKRQDRENGSLKMDE